MRHRPVAPLSPVVSDPSRFSRLSERETQVLSLAAAGYMDKQIVRELSLSLNTLRTYWSRIRLKVGDAPRFALAAAYVQYNADQERPTDPDWEIDLLKQTYRQLTPPTGGWRATLPEVVPLDAALAFIHPSDVLRVRQLIENPTAGISEFSYAVRFISEDHIEIGSAVVQVIRDDTGRAVKFLGRRIPNFDVRTPRISDVVTGYFTIEYPSGSFTADEGLCRIMRVDKNAENLRELIRSRLYPGEGSETWIEETVAAKLERSRKTSRLLFEDGSSIWISTDLRVVYKDGEPVRVLGTVLSFD